MITPKKISTGIWAQDLYQQSSTASEIVGTIRDDVRGNEYAYSKAGAAGLAVGIATVAADCDADVLDCSLPSAVAIGETRIDVTITSTTVVKDYFRGGDFIVNSGTGAGQRYMILSNSAVAADTAIEIVIESPLRVALVTGGTSQVSLIQSPYRATVISATDQADLYTGTPMIDVTAEYYYWSQINGIAASLIDETLAKNAAVCIGDGVTGAYSTKNAAGEAQVGIMMQDGVDTEYQAIKLGA